MAAVSLLHVQTEPTARAKQALIVWGIFILVLVLLNGTIPFLLGADLHAWTSSTFKSVIFDWVLYAGFFLIVPLVLTKGWATVRQPGFLIPLMAAAIGVGMHHYVYYGPILVIPVLGYLHWRYDLSPLGFRSLGWKGDLIAVLLMGGLSLLPLFFPGGHFFAPGKALAAAMDRLLANPASTVENLFYFGFLTERLLSRTGRWFTPLIVASFYTLHEMSNPEYWYGALSFTFVFVAIAVAAAIYAWRRSLVVTWLGDILSRFVTQLF